MTLQRELERSGRWLFRWRSFLPLLLLAVIAAAWTAQAAIDSVAAPPRGWQVVCLAVGLLGFWVRVVTIGYAPRGTSGRNTRAQRAHELNTTGLYSVVRDPLYLGNFFMGLGPAIYPQLWWLGLIYVLVFWLYYERIVLAEEVFLQHRFNQNYLDWTASTPAFVPTFRTYRRPDLKFSLRNVLRREYNGVFALIAVFFLLDLLGELARGSTYLLDPLWSVMLLAAVVVWATLRTLKRKTTWLAVKGR